MIPLVQVDSVYAVNMPPIAYVEEVISSPYIRQNDEVGGNCSPGYWKTHPEAIAAQLQELYANFNRWDGKTVPDLVAILENTKTMENKLERQVLAAALSRCTECLPNNLYAFTKQYEGGTLSGEHTIDEWVTLGLLQLDGTDTWLDEAYKDAIEGAIDKSCGQPPTSVVLSSFDTGGGSPEVIGWLSNDRIIGYSLIVAGSTGAALMYERRRRRNRNTTL